MLIYSAYKQPPEPPEIIVRNRFNKIRFETKRIYTM